MTKSELKLLDRLFLKLCHSPEESRANESATGENITFNPDALAGYVDCFGPAFLEELKGRSVLDFGFGSGMQVIAAVKAGAAHGSGIEIRESCVPVARKVALESGVADKTTFVAGRSQELLKDDSFDIVLSRDSFEHFDDPGGILAELLRILKPGGKAFICFGPLWYSPYGGHIQFMTRYPWLHLLFPEKTILAVRSLYRNDGATRFSEVEGGLNKMTIKRFRKLVLASGFKIDFFKVHSVKNLPLVSALPIVREFLSPYISTVLLNNQEAG